MTYCFNLANDVGLVISEEEDLASGPGTNLITQEILCSSYIKAN